LPGRRRSAFDKGLPQTRTVVRFERRVQRARWKSSVERFFGRRRARKGSGAIVGAIVGAIASGTAALSLILWSCGAMAGDAGVYTYTVLLNGNPVGRHRVVFLHQDGRTEIDASTDVEVRFAFIPVFRFEHRRREVWENGRPVYVVATTDNDGDTYKITVRSNGDGYIRIVNGRVERFDGPTAILTLWDPNVVRHDAFISVIDDKVVKASFEYRGRRRLSLSGQAIDTDYYRMVGDENREVWFDPAGHVAKVEFWEGGSKIEIVRNELTWRPLDDRLLAERAGTPARR
jgi:hypothetical protein